MLLSMTGHGEARAERGGLAFAVEIRAVNNRYLKVVLKAPEPYSLWEAEVERLVRRTVRRGTLQIHVYCQRPATACDYTLNTTALVGYARQIQAAVKGVPELAGLTPDQYFGGLFNLPGVVPETVGPAAHLEDDWPVLEESLAAALNRLNVMRQDEGSRMATELLDHCGTIDGEVREIGAKAPAAVVAYRDRILDRVKSLLADTDTTVRPDDLIREVAVFAERSDVAEELVRLDSHLAQFRETVKAGGEGTGRKLEFLTQEMGREANTIGSKAGDVAISKHALEVKASLEKIRELIQNVE